MTRVCHFTFGFKSRNAINSSFSRILKLGASQLAILQKMQSAMVNFIKSKISRRLIHYCLFLLGFVLLAFHCQKKLGIIKHKGVLAQPIADGGSILNWKKATIKETASTATTKKFTLNVPLGDTKEVETLQGELRYEKGKGWRVYSLETILNGNDIEFIPIFGFYIILWSRINVYEVQFINF